MTRISELASNLHYIADCLTKLEEIMNLPNCQDCAKLGACEYQPEWGSMVRINCPLWKTALWKTDKPKEG